jgi:RNA polymerase sigma factor (sigma-70 family)
MGRERDERLTELEALYRGRFGDFLHVATAIVGDEDRAHDAVQDAFASAVRSIGKYRGDGELAGWVWHIVLNAARLERRRAGRRGPPIHETSTNGHLDDPTGVRAAIAALPERQRQVLFLRYYADLDYAAIAAALDVSSGTVGATLNQAHTTLRSRLEEHRS